MSVEEKKIVKVVCDRCGRLLKEGESGENAFNATVAGFDQNFEIDYSDLCPQCRRVLRKFMVVAKEKMGKVERKRRGRPKKVVETPPATPPQP